MADTDQTVAHFTLLEYLGEGSLGDVYRARDTRVGRTVALKVVPASLIGDPARLERLLTDARAATRLSHPNIAALFDVGQADGRVYLAYEFVSGRILREEMAGAAMNIGRALDIAIQIADGLADGHAQHIIHGDLRPDTVMVTGKGSAKILDFGLGPWTRGGTLRARAARDPDALPADASSVLAYLSPEQAIGGGVDARTDVFSIATVIFEMLTGRNPFTGASPTDTVLNVIQAHVHTPSELHPGVPAEVDRVLLRALARDLSQRQQSAAGLAAELRSAAATLNVRTRERTDPAGLLPLDESPDKTPAGLWFGALAAALATAGIVWWWLSRIG